MSLIRKTFWIDTLERVIGTFAAALIPAVIGVALDAVNWPVAVSVAGSAALVTLLKAVVAGRSDGDPSLVSRQIRQHDHKGWG